MSHYNGWSDVPLTPEETWEQRAEAFRRGLSEVDQAGDMLAEERARAKRWKAAAKFWRRERERVRQALEELVDAVEQAEHDRDEARTALLARISQDVSSGA